MNNARTDHNAVITPNGDVVVLGGALHHEDGYQDPADAVLMAEVFEPYEGTNGEWRELAASTSGYYRFYHSTAVLMRDGRMLNAGSTTFETGYSIPPTAQIYTPWYLLNSDGSNRTRPTISNVPTNNVEYGENFTVNITIPNGRTLGKFTLTGLNSVTHSFDMNQRYIELDFEEGENVGEYVLTAPELPVDAPPGWYLIWVVTDNGVPSVGEYLWINYDTSNFGGGGGQLTYGPHRAPRANRRGGGL
jgi:hypothetical protein